MLILNSIVRGSIWFAICYRPSACLSVCRLPSVTLVQPTQEVEIFSNMSTALGRPTLAIR